MTILSTSTLLVLLTVALSTSALQRLSLKIDGPTSVDNIENFTVTTTITNTGDETLKVLRDPLSPMSKLPADTFAISTDRGAKPLFNGIKVKYLPQLAAEAGAFTVLAPAQAIKIHHDLAEAYSFARSGEGIYNIGARNAFYVLQGDGSIQVLHANVDRRHAAKLSGTLEKVHSSRIKSRATFPNCSASQQTAVKLAITAATNYATSSFLTSSAEVAATARYTTWFGNYTATRHDKVLSHFTAIHKNDFSTFVFNCKCSYPGAYAYVYPSIFGEIYLCDAFWKAPVTGRDSQGGTIIHEASHFTNNGGTQDHTYGQSGCKQLAKDSPDSAVENADSHEYYTENT
ncbi:zincin [Coprinopsis marcescibilis]|uniref:Zincin n=1 Tax=Coprinopsis marcescibilis TaxID=230819 RepID=A0A5C3KHT9_COPMA|nr:zincin [Coprinopsis marcescibilis]